MKINDVLQYHCCDQESCYIEVNQLRCSSCGTGRKIINGIITGNGKDTFDQDQDGSEVYVKQTMNLYKNRAVSGSYFRRYSHPSGLKDLYAWYIARREIKTVGKMMSLLNDDVNSVLDSPCGTGKLYPVHRRNAYDCVMSDISMEMMAECIKNINGVKDELYFVQSNAMNHCFRKDAFDCVIILRLLHRLSERDVKRVLDEAFRISSNYLIVSNSMNVPSMARFIHGKKPVEHEGLYWEKNKWREILERYGKIQDSVHVSRFISSEMLFLIKIDPKIEPDDN